MAQVELQEVLRQHSSWLQGREGGPADLRNADLRRADLRNADLRNAKMQLPDLYILKDQPPNTKLVAYKFLKSNLKSPYEGFQYKIGESYKTEDFNDDERILCDRGFNVATMQWCKRNKNETDSILVRVSFKAKDIVAIPFATDGKFRVKALTIEEIVKEEK